MARLLRDVSSWGGEARDWERVVREAELRGLTVGVAEKIRWIERRITPEDNFMLIG